MHFFKKPLFFIIFALVLSVPFFKAEAAVLSQDTFTDTAGVNLTAHTSDTGQTWIRHPFFGSTALLTGTGYIYTASGAGGVWLSSYANASPNYDVSDVVNMKTAVSGTTGVVARFNTSGQVNGYVVLYEATNTRWALYSFVNSSPTLLGSFTQTLTTGQDYALKLSLSGPNLTVSVNGTQIISATDSTYTTAGNAGIWADTNSTTSANGFQVGNFAINSAAAGPIISAVTSFTTATTANITWATDTSSNSAVNYGATTSYGSSASNASMVTSHSVTISGLSPATTYHYQVSSTDAGSNTRTGLDATFTTAAAGSYVQDTFTDTAGTLLQNHTSDTGVTYTKILATDTAVINNANQLRPNTTGIATYLSSATPNSSDYYVAADLNVKSIAGEGIYSVYARMNNARDSRYMARYNAFFQQWELYVENGGSYTPLGTAAQVLNVGQTYNLKLLVNGSTITVYVDSVSVISVTNSVVSGAGATGIEIGYQGQGHTPSDTAGIAMDNFTFPTTGVQDTTPPVISSVASSSVGSSTATITWTTDELSNSVVNYGTTTSYGSSSSSGTLTTSHSVTLTGLSATTTYHFKVSSTDGSSNTANSGDSTFTTTLPPAVIAVNNAGLQYSSYNWYINGSSYAITNSPGSYIKTNFTGTSVTINLAEDQLIGANADASYYPRIRYQIDGGSTTDVQLTPTTTSVIASTGLSAGTHALTIIFTGVGGGTYSDPDRWQTPVQSVKFTGLSLDNGSSVSLPTALSKTMLVYGDSISEGVRVNGVSGSSPNGDQDATKVLPWLLAKDLNVEVGVHALGGGGWTTVGSGGVPPVYTPGNDTSSMWNKYFAGQSLLTGGLFTKQPDYIYMNHGTNDQGSSDATVIASVGGWLTAVRAAAPNAVIFVTIPFGQFKASAITTAYNNYKSANTSDNKVFLIDLGSSGATGLNQFGTPSSQSADGLHPYAATNVTLESQVLPIVQNDLATLVGPVISAISSTPSTTGTSVSWTTDKTATTQVNYGTSASYGSSTTLNASLVTSHTASISGLNPSTLYHYQVVSTDGNGNTTSSSDQTFTTTAAPDTTAPTVSITVPTNGATVSGSQTVTATATDNVGVVGVQFKLDGSNLQAEDTSSPYSISWDTTGTSNGSHALTAVARDAAGNSTTSSTVTVTVSNATVPGAPTAVSATAGNAQATVTFSAPGSNGGSAITGYTVTSIPSGGTDSNAGSTSLSHVVTGLTNGTAYTFTVIATNGVGNSSASAASNSVTPFVPATTYTFTGPSSGIVNSASSNFTVAPNGKYTGTVTITPSGGGLSTPTVLTFSNSSVAQTFTITPTATGTVTLTPTNNGSLTNPSNLSYTVSPVPTAPGAPTGVTATAGAAQATVTFTAPASNGGATITGYTVTSIPSGGTDVNAGSTSLTHTITNLTGDTAYTFTVTATNSIGTSSASVASNSVTPTVPVVTTTGYLSGGGGGSAANPFFQVPPTACGPNDLFNASTGLSCVKTTIPPVIVPTINLSLGSTGKEVKALQQYLNTHGFAVTTKGAGSKGNETTTFGPATKTALIKFQKAKGISPATGIFGPLTRKAMGL